jgi:polysaccharide pyruvyl transferase WcaK-like protein
MNNNLFILAGNGSYDNRGCEAITKGTIKILRHHFDNPKFVVLNLYSSEEQFKKQISEESDENILHKKTFIFNKSMPVRIFNKLRFSLQSQDRRIKTIYKEILPHLKESEAVLSLGGDNYSLDYGKPTIFTDLDNLVLSRRKPMIIWGASVGPFSKLPSYEEYMKEHFKKITGIFARESLTVDYLANIGITKNVYRVADPAFLVDAVEPPEDKFNKKIPDGAIGINLSYLMANYAMAGDLNKWTNYCVKIVEKVIEETRRPIYLIPHVAGLGPSDHYFCQKVLSLINVKQGEIVLIPDNLNFQETKWIINKMFVFLGSRTHSMISALSAGVPAVSLVYSMKGKGINRDFYGNDNFCIEKDKMSPEVIAQKINELIKNQPALKKQIVSVLPKVRELAFDAGKYLKDIIACQKT